ncbi:MAG TPA: GNAT family N-acetyltransferase [Acidimicrobiales bacterium]|nr:GNAT family N-acetyltransferase [Acidimicrobiales bacterium]
MGKGEDSSSEFRVVALDESTWEAFADLVERHNGVWGGCWCMAFHPEMSKTSAEDNRLAKRRRVAEGTARASLVLTGGRCVGWCQFGSPDELPRIKNRRAYEDGLVRLPVWRITCFFVDRGYRRRGVTGRALDGALAQIADLGGGIVESYPEDTSDRSVSGSFLHNGTVRLFERHGFNRTRRIGKHRWVVTASIPGAA